MYTYLLFLGGTVDTTILQSSEEIAISTSWNFGGNKVNNAFMQIWSEILGTQSRTHFCIWLSYHIQ